MGGSLLYPEAGFADDEDPATPAVMLPVTGMGIEREGLRGNTLVIKVSMGTEKTGWAGICLTRAVKAACSIYRQSLPG